MAVDSSELPLRWWSNATGSNDAGHGPDEAVVQSSAARNTTLLAGRNVRFRIGFRDTTIYALVLESAGKQ